MKFSNYQTDNYDGFLRNVDLEIKKNSKSKPPKKSAVADCVFAKHTTTDNVSTLEFIDCMIGWSLNLF